MRHGKKFNHLGRKAAHRDAMLSNMAVSLIRHKRINTTVAKAKALRKYIEPLITKSKKDDTHSRRIVFSYLQDKESVTELFNNVSEKISSRPGGYTRIIKTGARLGDNAEMCMMELVDYNELLMGEADAKPKTRRSRRSKSKPAESKAATVETTEEVVEAEVVEESSDTVEEVVAEAQEEVTPEASTSEEAEDSSDSEDSSEEEKK